MRALAFAALLALPQVNDGVLEVTVRDPALREGLPAVQVTITLLPTQPTQPPTFVVKSFTDDKGSASFRNLVYGVYAVSVERDGYGGSTPQNLFIREDRPRQQVEFTLTRAMTLSGRVLKADGTPFVNAHVTPLLLTYQDGRRTLSLVTPRLAVSEVRSTPVSADAYTNERGYYRLPGLPPGEYYLRVDSAGFLTADDDRDARTTYYPGVPQTSEASPVILRGQDVGEIDIRIPDAPVFKISGILAAPESGSTRPDGKPPANNTFHLAPADSDNIDQPATLYVRNVTTETPGESLFEIRGVVPGVYYLYATRRFGQSDFAVRTLVQVDDRDVTGLRIVLNPGPELKGRILVEGNPSTFRWNNAGVALDPREYLPLLLAPPGLLRGAERLEIQGRAETDFTLSGMIEGVRYVPTPYGLPPDAYVADLRQGGISVYSNGGAIRSNAVDGPIEIVIARPGGTVEGIVRSATGQSVNLSRVVLVPSAPRRDAILLYKETGTDGAGRFSFQGVAPGEYKVFSWQTLPGRRAYLNQEFLAAYESRGTSVKVAAGGTTAIQVTVAPLQ